MVSYFGKIDFKRSQNYSSLSRRPIARLFDGLTNRLENQMKNRAIGQSYAILKNRMKSDVEESDEIGWSLTCHTQSDGSHTNTYF